MAEQSVFQIRGSVRGARQVAVMLNVAPEVYRRRIAGQLGRERDMFVGRPKKEGGRPGVFRRKLERRRLWGGRVSVRGHHTWSSQFTAGAFRGAVLDAQDLNRMKLRMGVLYNTKRPIHEAAEFLGQGGTISGGMIVPMYRNLQRVGVKVKVGMAGKVMSAYQARAGSGHRLVAIRRGGRINYHDAKLLSQGFVLSSLMFVGVRAVHVRRQYDFEGDWQRREPKAFGRLQKAVDKATERVMKGKTT
jgi:hypothetical protein